MKLDLASHLAFVEAGELFCNVEAELNAKNLTTGFWDGVENRVSIGVALERAIPNFWADYYGELHQICLQLQTDSGFFPGEVVPRSAAGPDLKRALIGAGKQNAKILMAVMALSGKPAHELVLSARFSKRESRDLFLEKIPAQGIRTLERKKNGPLGAVLRLAGEEEIVDAESAAARRLALSLKGKILRKTWIK